MQSYTHNNTQFSLTLIFVTLQLILSTPLQTLLKFKKLHKHNKYNASSFFNSKHQHTAIMNASQFTVA